MDLLFLVQTMGLVMLVITSGMALLKSHKTIMRMNYLAILIGAGLILYANITHELPLHDSTKPYYQAGITILIIIVAGLVPSLRQVESLWTIKI